MEKETKKQMSAGIVLSYMVIIVQVIAGLLYIPIVLSSLGQSQYGIYSLCTSFMGYLTIMNGGVNAAYIRFYVQTKVKDESKIPALNGMFLKIFVVLSFTAFVGGQVVGIFSPQIFGNKINISEYALVKQCFRILAINSAAQVLNCVFSSIITANEKFIFAKAVNLLTAIASPVITTPFLLKGYNCVIIVTVQLVMSIITLILNTGFCLKVFHTKFDLRENDKDLLKDIAQFSGFIVLQSIMDQLNWQIDKFILARTHGTEEISLYSVGATFNTYYMNFSSALPGVFIAQINKLQAKHENDQLNKLFVQTSRVFGYLVLLFMAAFSIFGHKFVIRWAGLEYSISYTVGMLLMLPVTLALCMGLGQDIARAKNKHQFQIIINFLVCIVNVFVSVPLALKWGAVGSALGTFVSEIFICMIIQPIYYHRVLKLDMKAVFKGLIGIVPGLLPCVLYGFVITYFNVLKPDYINIFVYGLFFILIYAVSMWFLSMNSQEKDMVRKVLHTISRRG